MQKIKVIYQNNKNIFHNMSYMTVLKIFMLILPLISYPYLIRVVGSENFGKVLYILSIIAFFRIFVKFGFEMSAVKNVAEKSDDKKELSKIVSSVLILQFIFYIIGFLLLLLLMYLIPQFRENQQLLFYAYLLPLCDILFLVWFFQGIEKMKYITIINVIAGVIGLAFIFLVIREKEDYMYIPLLQAISLMIGSLYSLWLVFREENITFYLPTQSDLLFYFKESFPFFISRSSAVFNTEANTLLLANFVHMSAVSYYDLAKKIITVFQIPNSIINQVIYPNIAKTKNKVLAKKVFFIRLIIAFFMMLIVYAFGKFFVVFLGGTKMLETLNILNLFSGMLFLTAISYYAGSTLLVSFGHASKFNMSVIYGTIVYLLAAFILYMTDSITINSIIYLMLLVEGFVMLYRYYYCRRYKIL